MTVTLDIQRLPAGRGFVLTAEQLLPRPREEVFAFFADAANLEVLTPPWVGFTILTPLPITMARGTRIEYRIRIHGIGLRWETLIPIWEPPDRFVDEQVRGPYRRWVHEHTFESQGTATLCRDRVQYELRGGRLLAGLAHRWFVRPDLERIFGYRAEQLAARFPANAPPPGG
jgi:ligand-binding SRPBCC domain-containing protein